MDIYIPDLRGQELIIPTKSYVILDIETTGFGYYDGIIEFAAIKINNGECVDSMSILINPEREIPPKVVSVTGITDNMVADSLTFSAVADTIIDFIGDHMIMGHNITFDIDRLNNKLYTAGKRTLNNEYFDVMQMFKSVFPDLASYSLEAACFCLDISTENHHRALADCYMTWECFLKLFPDYKHTYAYMSEKVSNLPEDQQIEILRPIYLKERERARRKRAKLRQKDVALEATEFSESHPLFSKTVVITGSLVMMSRKDAYQMIKNVGGLCGDNVTTQTNYLVTNSTAMTGKMKKALQYQEKGLDIKIITEKELYELIG